MDVLPFEVSFVFIVVPKILASSANKDFIKYFCAHFFINFISSSGYHAVVSLATLAHKVIILLNPGLKQSCNVSNAIKGGLASILE